MHWEVEQKFHVSGDSIVADLAALGVRFSPAIAQCDRYFNHPARDFAVTDEALRIRQVGDQNYLTYKGPKIDLETKTRQEIELPLGDFAEVAGRMAQVLTALGFRPAGMVKKTRQTGSLTWEGNLVDISLDKVDELGAFLEFEIIADDRELPTARAALKTLADRLRLADPERQSYLELLLASRS